MRPFSYARPRSLGELIAVLETHGPSAALLAGGTDLIVRLRAGHARPAVVVDIKAVDELAAGILERPDSVRIGARTVMTDIEQNAIVRRYFPALADAAAVVGSVQIRNRATLADNMCNASPAADTAPALLVYGAVLNVNGPEGPRHVPLSGFFTGPGRTVLGPAEVVESIDLPRPARPTGAAFGRVTRRFGVDLATINLCAMVDASGRIGFAYGAVAPTPVLVSDVASGRLSPGDEDAMVEQVMARVSPMSDIRGSREYRLAMVDVMTRRTLRRAIDRLAHAREREP